MSILERIRQWRSARRAERRLFQGTDEEFRAHVARFADRIPTVTRTLRDA